MFYYVSEHEAWANKIYRRFVNLRTDYQKLQHQRDPKQPLTALQQWKLKELAYLKQFYKQGYKAGREGGAVGGASRTSTEHESEDEHDDSGHESSSSSRKETPTKIPVLNNPLPLRRPKKRREERTESDKDEASSKLTEIVDVMKNSASHLVARSQTVGHDPREQERVSFFQWMLEFTSRMPRHKWREFEKQSFNLAMDFTAESPPQNPSRARISQGPSTSSSQADHAQHPMHPPARPPPPASGGFVELLQSQPTEMVSKFLWSFCKCGFMHLVETALNPA